MKVILAAIGYYFLFLNADAAYGFHTAVSGRPPRGVPSSIRMRGGDSPNRHISSTPEMMTMRMIHNGGATTSLMSTIGGDDADAGATSLFSKIDFGALSKYILALAVQMSLFYGLCTGLDKFVVPRLGGPLPMFVNIPLFYICALKSRIFNPLSNRRPLPSTKELEETQQEQRTMPTWTPPGFIFPIVWLLLIGPLRAVTSSMIVKETGVYTTKALLALMLHLSIGDVWNTINNVERRYGTSVLGVSGVYASAAYAARRYHHVLPLAGKLLALKLIWLTVASALIVRTWQLNPNPSTGKPYSLLPKKGEGAETELIWLQRKE
jgi:benzodiazapine receptor